MVQSILLEFPMQFQRHYFLIKKFLIAGYGVGEGGRRGRNEVKKEEGVGEGAGS